MFLSQLQAQPGISWVAFGWPDDAFFAAHKLGEGEFAWPSIASRTHTLYEQIAGKL